MLTNILVIIPVLDEVETIAGGDSRSAKAGADEYLRGR